MASRGFEYFEHTADVGIRAWGEDVGDAFGAAAEGLVANIVDVTQARATGEARLELEADTRERLLHHFLEEVLFSFQTRGWVVTRARVTLDGPRLVATLEGEAYDAARHGHIHEVKAITMHDLVVQDSPPEVRVILDI